MKDGIKSYCIVYSLLNTRKLGVLRILGQTFGTKDVPMK